MIRIYDKDYALNEHLNSNGLKVIQALKCIEHKNGSEWFLEMEVDDNYSTFLEHMNVVVVETKQGLFQPFRIRNPKTEKHVVSFTAKHVFFDLENYYIPSLTITNQNGLTALNMVLGASVPSCPFSASSDFGTTASLSVEKMSVAQAIFELADAFNGHVVLNNFTVAIQSSIGSNRGVEIRYGKNLQGMSVVENWDNVVTKLIPTCGDRVYSAIDADVSYDIPYVKTISFESKLEDESAIQADVVAQATAYLNKYKYPLVNYTVKSDVVQDVQLGDTIRVVGAVELNTNVLAYTYNIVTSRVLSVEFGNYRQTVKNLFSSFKSLDDIKEQSKAYGQVLSDQARVIAGQTDTINGLYKYGYVVVNDNEIFIVDTLPKESATYVLRMNLGGIGFSSSGIGGPFTSAWTLDGVFNANYIQAGSLNGINMSIGSADNIFKADSNGIYLGNATFGLAPFRVAMDGTGAIGGFNFDGNKLYRNVASGQYVAISPGSGSNGTGVGNYAIWAGHSYPSAARFSVTLQGDVKAEDVYIMNWRLYGDVNTNYMEGDYIKITDSLSLTAIYLNKSTSKGFIWNTGRITCNTDFNPVATNTYLLGSTTFRWKGIYLNTAPDVSSDIRLKENINVIGNEFNDVILNTEIISYNLIGNDEKALGINANKFHDIFKDKAEFTVSKDDNGYYGVKYESFIPMMIKTIQALHKRISALEEK